MPTAQVTSTALNRASWFRLNAWGVYKPLERPINLIPSQQYAAGTILGEVSATPGTFRAYAGSTVTNPTTAPVLTQVNNAGFLPAGTYYVVYTLRNGAGETLKSTEASITTTGANSAINVVVPTLNPGAIGANVYVGTATGAETFSGQALPLPFAQTLYGSPMVNTAGPASFATTLTYSTSYAIVSLPPSNAAAFPTTSSAIAATDGSQVPKCILPNAVSTDQNGYIYPATGNVTGPIGVGTGVGFGESTWDAYFTGDFIGSYLFGFDANCLNYGFRMLFGTVGSPTSSVRLS